MLIFFAIAYIYDGVLYDCTSRFYRVFTHKQPGQSEFQNEQNPFFQVDFFMFCDLELDLHI